MRDAEQHARLEAAEWIVLLEDAPEDAALRERFENWLDADPLHVRAWARLSDTASLVASSPAVLRDTWEAPRSGAWLSGADGMVAGRRSPAVPGFRTGPRIALAVAAAIALVLLAPWIALNIQADYVTGAGAIRAVALADGSRLELGPDSAVAVGYDDGERDIRLLAGQAWFDVAHDPARPFRVAARDVTATALGTAFSVRVIGEAVSVEVDRGRVRVGGGPGTPARELGEGQWTRIDGKHVDGGEVQARLRGAWRQGRIHVRDRTIADVVEELRPWYRGRIILTDSEFANERVSGLYDVRDPEDALRTIVHPHGGTVTSLTPWLLIVSGG